MELKEGYQMTDLGMIPSGWDVKPLQEVAHFRSGASITSKDIKNESGFPVYGGNGLRGYTSKHTHSGSFPIIGRQGALCGNVNFATGTFFASEHAVVASVKKDISPKWLYYVLVKMNLNQYTESSAQPGLSVNKIILLPIVTPSFLEQTAIATALSDMDALIAQTENLIEKKKAIKQGVMQLLLSPYDAEGKMKEGWVMKKLGDVGKCHRGVSYKPENDLHLYDNENTIRLFRSNNIQNSIVELQDVLYVDSSRVKPKQILQDNDIVICMANGSKQLVGKSAVFRKKDKQLYTFGAFMGCFRTDEQLALRAFVELIFQTKNYRNHIDLLLSGSSINNLSPGNIESIIIALPTLTEQIGISKITNEMNIEILNLSYALSKLRKIKQGMMQNLLTGKIRIYKTQHEYATAI